MKDIFIDTMIASRFTNPMDDAYKELCNWLLHCNHEIKENNSSMVVSKKLLAEYFRSNSSQKGTSIAVIINAMTMQGRLSMVSSNEVKDFIRLHIPEKKRKKLPCNAEDIDHIPLVFLSQRKMALTADVNFRSALVQISGFNPIIGSKPNEIQYK